MMPGSSKIAFASACENKHSERVSKNELQHSLAPPPPLSTLRGVHFGEAFLKAKAFKPEPGADSSAVPLAKRLEV